MSKLAYAAVREALQSLRQTARSRAALYWGYFKDTEAEDDRDRALRFDAEVALYDQLLVSLEGM